MKTELVDLDIYLQDFGFYPNILVKKPSFKYPLSQTLSSFSNIKTTGRKIINLRPIINKKSQEKSIDLLTKLALLSKEPKPKVINLRPIIEKKVAQEQAKNLTLMGLPLLLTLL